MGQTFVEMHLFLNLNQLPFLFRQSLRTDLWANIYFIWLFTCTRMVILSHTCTIEWGVTYSFLYEHFPLNRSYRIWVGLSSIQSCTANLSLIFLQKYLQLKFRKSWNQIIVSSILPKNEWKNWGYHKLLARFSDLWTLKHFRIHAKTKQITISVISFQLFMIIITAY